MSFFPRFGRPALGVAIVLTICLGDAEAYEHYTTTALLIRRAPYVAHVRIDGGRRVAGAGHVREYRLDILENLKGKLPRGARVRVPISSRVVEPDGRPDPAGTEWIVILGRRTSRGIYPLRSLKWGKIEIFVRESTGEKMLARPLTGMPGRGGTYSLKRFRGMFGK